MDLPAVLHLMVSADEAKGGGDYPQDIGEPTHLPEFPHPLSFLFFFSAAIFHASFHPTRGNVVDWSLKASDGA